MTSSCMLTPTDIASCVDSALTLAQLLEDEFTALKNQNLDQFEHLLSEKNLLLANLSRMSGIQSPQDADQLGPEWTPFRQQMQHCQQLHRRNEILIMRKLDAIQGALDSLQVQQPASNVEVYDRLGQVRRSKRLRAYTEA